MPTRWMLINSYSYPQFYMNSIFMLKHMYTASQLVHGASRAAFTRCSMTIVSYVSNVFHQNVYDKMKEPRLKPWCVLCHHELLRFSRNPNAILLVRKVF